MPNALLVRRVIPVGQVLRREHVNKIAGMLQCMLSGHLLDNMMLSSSSLSSLKFDIINTIAQSRNAMNLDRIILIAIIAVAVLATIPQIPVDAAIWGLILVVIGIVGGVTANFGDLMQRLIIYVLAVAIPTFANSLDFIMVVGPFANTLLVHLATGIQGMAVGLLGWGLAGRVMGTIPAASD